MSESVKQHGQVVGAAEVVEADEAGQIAHAIHVSR